MNQPKPLIRLGSVDPQVSLEHQQKYLEDHHEAAMPKDALRDEGDNSWRAFARVDGETVRELQMMLREFDFYPRGAIDGIFGYRTVSAARLFQEYVRSIENRSDIGIPDGVIGSKSWQHLQRWSSSQLRADWHAGAGNSSENEFRYWQALLEEYRQINLDNPMSPVIDMLNDFDQPTDTLPVEQWQIPATAEPHLIGIRRQEWRQTGVRKNDDLLVLLVNGQVFKFYGSTDPNPRIADRTDEAFLIRGQHLYRFGWHKRSDRRRCYRAFRPARYGVLISRDFTDDNAFTEADLQGGLSRNLTINIHWSGSGTSNWSAGCQVVAGDYYLNHHNQKIDCQSFAARSYVQLPARTRAAYNVLLDLITIFAPDCRVKGGPQLRYTLMYERDLNREIAPGKTLSGSALDKLNDLDPMAAEQLKQVTAPARLCQVLLR